MLMLNGALLSVSIAIAAAAADGWHGPTVRVVRGAGFPSFSIAREGHAASTHRTTSNDHINTTSTTRPATTPF